MESARWWNVAVIGTAVVLTALLFLEQAPTGRLVGAASVNAALVVTWFVLGPRALKDRRFGVAITIAVIVLASIGVGFESSMATIQCICFPLIWVVLDRTRDAIIANVVLAVSLAIATVIGLGATGSSVVVATSIEAISLAFSLALGLWITGISTQSFERQKLIDELEAAQAQLSILSRDAGVAGERERLAREIHDTIAQDLTGLVMTAQRSRRELDGGNLEAVGAQLAVLEENARNALAETRALVASGSAVGVDGGGLAIALRRLGERFARETGIAVIVNAADDVSLGRDAEVVLLRCTQEALANVRKHSAAASATLTLTVEGGTVTLSVNDDGRGFDASAPGSGFGLEGMRERLALVRGSLAVNTRAGGGTELVASLPMVTA